jgi:endo-1,4-beta-mannosidase
LYRSEIENEELFLMNKKLNAAIAAFLSLSLTSVSQSSADINHETTATTVSRTSDLVPLQKIKLMNYYPSARGWAKMWTDWKPDVINADFARIAALHANSVRIILQASVIGYPAPQPVMQEHLARIVDMAAAHGLRVQLTLFDWWHDYADIAGSKAWAQAVLTPYAHDHRIAFVELKNEILPRGNDATVMAWARQMIPFIRQITGDIPVTVSTTGNPDNLQTLIEALQSSQPDFYDHHVYLGCNVTTAYRMLSQLQSVAHGKPLFIGETGFSSSAKTGCFIPSTQAAAEAYQDFYLRNVEYAAKELDMPAASPWILYDFAPGSLSNVPPSSPEYDFGLLRIDGSSKPAAESISRFFDSGEIDSSFNNGFEEDAGGLPAAWRIYHASEASFARDAHAAHSGVASARISNSTGDSSGLPAFFTTPVSSALATIIPGHVYTVSAWVKGENATGKTGVAIAWFSEKGKWLGSTLSSALPNGTTPWTQLTAKGAAPSDSTYVEIHLTSAYNKGTAWFDDVAFTDQ